MERKNNVVVSNIIENDGKILLFREKLKNCYGKWNFPGGKLDLDEDILTCAKREAKEETGFDIEPKYLIAVYQYSRPLKDNVIRFTFKSDIPSGKSKIDKEVLEVRWLTINEIKGMSKKGELRNSDYMIDAIGRFESKIFFPLNTIKHLDINEQE
jgi:ADP-ribose pyrophosphatase YjhB (NUDIX family)